MRRRRVAKGPGVKVTIKEIAERANVSKSTISRVLNNSGPVSERTRRLVMDTVQELDYRPNEIARSLSRGKTHSIGIIMQDIRNPYYANACWYADRLFERYGFNSIISNADNDPDREDAFLNAMRYRNVEGILCIGAQEDTSNIVKAVEKTELPIVLVDSQPTPEPIDTVGLDNVYGGQLVVDYLLALGHERIAFITSDFTSAERGRKQGYLQALSSRGIPVDPDLIVTIDEESWHRSESPELLDLLRRSERPTAIFASNDFKAIRILRLLHRVGVSVPGEISLVGYDDIDSASIVIPALTTVHQPIDKMIDIGAQILLRRLDGQGEAPEHAILRSWLVERESARKLQ